MYECRVRDRLSDMELEDVPNALRLADPFDTTDPLEERCLVTLCVEPHPLAFENCHLRLPNDHGVQRLGSERSEDQVRFNGGFGLVISAVTCSSRIIRKALLELRG